MFPQSIGAKSLLYWAAEYVLSYNGQNLRIAENDSYNYIV